MSRERHIVLAPSFQNKVRGISSMGEQCFYTAFTEVRFLYSLIIYHPHPPSFFERGRGSEEQGLFATYNNQLLMLATFKTNDLTFFSFLFVKGYKAS
jgi:hypothetical protein